MTPKAIVMSNRKKPGHLFHSAADDRRHARIERSEIAQEQINSPAYKLAYDDIDFLLRDEMRPVRFLLELSKPELLLQEHGVENTVVIFGSARTCDMEAAMRRRNMLDEALATASKDNDLRQQLARVDNLQIIHQADCRMLRDVTLNPTKPQTGKDM